MQAMEVDEKPTEDYSDIGGLDKQIQELVEAIVLPVTHKDRFKALGIKPPKGVLLYGPPGTGPLQIGAALMLQQTARSMCPHTRALCHLSKVNSSRMPLQAKPCWPERVQLRRARPS